MELWDFFLPSFLLSFVIANKRSDKRHQNSPTVQFDTTRPSPPCDLKITNVDVTPKRTTTPNIVSATSPFPPWWIYSWRQRLQRMPVRLHISPISKGHVAAARKRSHQWCVSLTPNNTKTIGRMTCHYFLRQIRRDLTSSSYTTHFLY